MEIEMEYPPSNGKQALEAEERGKPRIFRIVLELEADGSRDAFFKVQDQVQDLQAQIKSIDEVKE